MTKRGSILTFDEARKATGRPRSSGVSANSSAYKAQRRRSPEQTYPSGKKNTSSAKISTYPSASRDAQRLHNFGTNKAAQQDEARSSLGKSTTRVKTRTSTSTIAAHNITQFSERKIAVHDEAYAARRNKTRSQSSTRGFRNTSVSPAASESGKIPKISKFSEIKKNRSKSKVEKQFSKQFQDAPSDASCSGSRPALYKTEMGRHHKKSSKMQSGIKTGALGFLGRFSFVGFDIKRSPIALGALMVSACLVLSCVFLYPTAQQFYVTQREYDQVQAEYQALESRNDSIQEQVNLLSSDQGIEDRAREEFGWVKEGENAATVYGLDSDSNKEVNYKKSIPAGSVEAPSAWYTPILDAVFGIE